MKMRTQHLKIYRIQLKQSLGKKLVVFMPKSEKEKYLKSITSTGKISVNKEHNIRPKTWSKSICKKK